MSQEIVKKDEAMAVLSPEDQAVLSQARQMNTRNVIQMYDTIKLKDSEKKMLDFEGKPLPRGEYYVESYDGEKPEGQRRSYRNIGANPEIVIIHRCFTYSYYQEGEGKGLMAFTTDIQNFTDDDYVQLLSRKAGQKMTVEFSGNYPELKNVLAARYTIKKPDGSEEKLMTFQNLLYVMFEGKIYRMFVSNASTSGVKAGETKPSSFKNPEPKSLLQFIETTKKNQGSAICEYRCKLGSYFKDDVEQPYYIRTFENMGPCGKEILVPAVQELKKMLLEIARSQRAIMERKNISDLRTEVVMDTEVVDVHPEMPKFD